MVEFKFKIPEGPGGRIRRIVGNYINDKSCMTPERVAQIDYAELAGEYNFGRRSMDELRAWLQSHGRDLKNAPPVGGGVRCPHCGLVVKIGRRRGMNGL